MKIADIRFVPAPPELRATGLRGWAACDVDSWRFESLAVRRTQDGRYVLSFPSRRDRSGVERFFYKPIDTSTRIAIETTVLEDLRRRGFIS